MPILSAIVPVRNEATHIRQTLLALVHQELPGHEFEILVVDGRSDDQTVAIVEQLQREYPQIQLFDNPKRLSSAARNVGVINSTGEYIVIVDGHCAIHDRYHFKHIVDAFERSGADTLGRPQPLRAAAPSRFQRLLAAARHSWLGHNPDSSIFSDQEQMVDPDNVAVAYRRDVFERIGGFDEQFDACEYVDFNTRARMAGFNCFFTPAIGIDYSPRTSLRGLMYQMLRYGRGRARLAKKYPSSITLPSLVPPGWLLWLVVGAIAAAFSPWALLAYISTIISYSLIVFGESTRLALKERPSNWWLIPIIFASIHASFGWGYWRELFTFKRPSRVLIPVSSRNITPTLLPFPQFTNKSPTRKKAS